MKFIILPIAIVVFFPTNSHAQQTVKTAMDECKPFASPSWRATMYPDHGKQVRALVNIPQDERFLLTFGDWNDKTTVTLSIVRGTDAPEDVSVGKHTFYYTTARKITVTALRGPPKPYEDTASGEVHICR